MVRFVHTGDLHLGLKFQDASFSKAIGKDRRIELWQTFERIVTYTRDNNIDFLFIAGDLFEAEYFTIGHMKRLRDILGKAKNQRILIAGGNHDSLSQRSFYRQVEWPENVHIFSSTGIEKKEYKDLDTEVYGYSWDGIENNRDIIKEIPNLDKKKNNILIIHGDVYSRDSKYLPLSAQDLQGLGFDYIGLGHIHKPEIFSNKMAYCGSPEPLDFGEPGRHGIIQGKIKNGSSKINFVNFSHRQFKILNIEIDETMSYIGIRDRIREVQNGDRVNFYRLEVTGILNSDIDLQGLGEEIRKDFYYLEIIDKTDPDFDLASLEDDNKDNLIGFFIGKMRQYDLSDEVYKEALYLGLKSLMEGRLNL